MKISFAVDMLQTETHGWETQVAAALDHNGSNDENKDCGIDSPEPRGSPPGKGQPGGGPLPKAGVQISLETVQLQPIC